MRNLIRGSSLKVAPTAVSMAPLKNETERASAQRSKEILFTASLWWNVCRLSACWSRSQNFEKKVWWNGYI